MLKDQEYRLETEANELADKRDKLNGRMRNLRDEVLELRNRRDELNSKVKELKQRRNEMTTRIHERLEKIRRLEEDKKALVRLKPAKNHEILQKEVESIDWTIQTTSLSLQEDKQLVEKVKQLETQIAIHKKFEQVTKSIVQMRAEIRGIKSESELAHQQLTENAQKSQETHKEMFEKIEESRGLRTEADNVHKQFLQARERIKPLQEEGKTVLSQIRQLRQEIHKEVQKEKKESENALRETLEKQAKDKLRRGEKLSWEEFQLLAENGMAYQD